MAAAQPLVVIVGETASGKSNLALKLAKKFNGEIISADSWTVYKGFDIGTAKPTKKEQKAVQHHLIDIADPNKGFDAAIFKKKTSGVILNIGKKSKLPILVGGTGLYIDSILYDYSFLPAPSPRLRQKLNNMSLEDLLEHADKQGVDTLGIDLRNKRRVIRLIENNGIRPTKKPLRSNTLILGIKRPLNQLEARIERRIDAMVGAGFVEEIKGLLNKYSPNIEAFKAPGYKAFKEYVLGNITLNEAKLRFKRSDMQLAKKQRTWFKRNNSIQWVDNNQQAISIVHNFLKKQM